MAKKTPQPRSPGTEVVPKPDRTRSGVTSVLLVATDLTVGVASEATRLAIRLGARGRSAGVAAGRLVSSLPGAGGTGRLLDTATRPLVGRGREIRVRARAATEIQAQHVLEAVVPSVVDALDIDALVQRIDIDQLVRRIEIDELVGRIDIDALVRRIEIDDLVQRIDIDQLVGRIDIDALVRRIDIDRLVGRIDIDAVVQQIGIDAVVQQIDIDRLVGDVDIDALMQRIDLDAVVARIDVNSIAERIDVDAVVEKTELGTIVARSTSGFASEALDTARSQTAGVDTRVSRAVNRVLRRKEGEMPVGPPLLTGETSTEDMSSASDTESPPPHEPDAGDRGSR